MSMTKKQAKAFVEDDNNWAGAVFGELVRVSVLSFRDRHWMKLEVPALEWEDVYRNVPNPRKYWRLDRIYEFNFKHNTAGPDISITQLGNTIWELDRA